MQLSQLNVQKIFGTDTLYSIYKYFYGMEFLVLFHKMRDYEQFSMFNFC